MKLGSDFFLIWRIIVTVMKALIEIIGTDEDKAELKKNHLT